MATFNQSAELLAKKRLAEQLAAQQRNYGTYKESDYVRGLRDQATESRNALNNYGDFSYARQADYDKIFGEYMNRPKFTWDADSDSLYQIYKDKYIRNARLAMQDTMGQAAALTGGYGNSYAETVGQQAYQGTLAGLNDAVPQLYQLALQRYNAEGDEMRGKIGTLQADRNALYAEYNDKYNRLLDKYNVNYGFYGDERGREKDDFDTAYARLVDSLNNANTDYGNSYSRDYENFRSNEADRQWAEQMAFQRQQWEWQKAQAEKAAAAALSSGSRSGGSGGGGSGNNSYNASVDAAQNSDDVKLFNASIMTRGEFARHGGSSKYGSYENYVTSVLDKWRKGIPNTNRKLTDVQVAAIVGRYGL